MTTTQALAATVTLAPAVPRHSVSPLARWRRLLAANRLTLVGAVLVVVLVFAAVAAPFLASADPYAQSAVNRLAPPDAAHPLGRDTFGRDVLARILYAARVSLVVGVGAVALGGALGTTIGLVAGYSGRWAETVLMRLVDVLMSFPSLLLGLMVMAVLGAGLDRLILSIGLVLASQFARVVYGATLSLQQREFVIAARSIGAGHVRIVLRHLLPNVLGETIVLGSLLIASAIRIEASLSFVGLGVSPPVPTWGNMIRDGTPLLLNAPWLSVFPGMAILLAVLAFNLLGDGLRDLFDPQSA